MNGLVKFHLLPNGDASRCEAWKQKCPFGGLSGEENHYPSIAAARRAYEERKKSELFTTFKKNESRVSQLSDDCRLSDNKVLVRKGIYLLGDVNSVLYANDRLGQEWSSVVDEDQRGVVGASVDGSDVPAVRSMDGVFTDSFGRKYTVDSGYIGLIPAGLVKSLGLSGKMLKDSHNYVEFDSDVVMDLRGDGGVYFGDDVAIYIADPTKKITPYDVTQESLDPYFEFYDPETYVNEFKPSDTDI